jgi:pilus assembly protein TadC
VAAALAVGSPPGEAWAALAGAGGDDVLGPAARALARAADGGAPVAAAVSRLAAEARADARARGEQAARRVGVLAVAPLGLCFLPAFVLLGVVPVIVGLAGPLLASF